MKKFFKTVGRVLFFLSFIFFVATSVVLGSILILKNNEYLKTSESYNTLQTELNKTSQGLNQSSQESKQTIDNLNSELESLKTKNTELEETLSSYQKTGEGIIQGKVTGQIVLGQDNLSQYQLICAQNVANKNELYCKSISTINQNFEISLPAGKYLVFAKVLNKDSQIVLNEYSGKYTEYVKCLTEKATGSCDVTLSGKQIVIEVKPTQKIVNVNPVDWN